MSEAVILKKAAAESRLVAPNSFSFKDNLKS